MKYVLILIGILLICSSVVAQVELPEPTALPAVKYEFEILKSPSTAWQPLLGVTYTVVDGNVGTHIYIARWGTLHWEAVACESITTAPKKVTFSFDYTPSGLYDVIKVHVRGFIEPESPFAIKDWSDPSFWVQVYRIGKPGRPIFR